MMNHATVRMDMVPDPPEDRPVALVTGAGGFIASNLTNTLADDGYAVYALDNLMFGTFENLDDHPHIYPVNCDVTTMLPPTVFEETEVVYHLAAKSSTKMHEQAPREGAHINVEGFVNVLEECLSHGVSDVVYASSSTVYGNPDTVPTHEDVPLDPTTRYAASKAARERYAVAYRAQGLNVAGARFFSTYQGYEHNEGHKDEHGNVISMFAEAMAQGNQPVVYGDGTQTRDFIHVSDVVRALRAMRGENDEFNVCRGEAVTFNEVVDELNAALGTDIDAEYIEPPLDGEYVATQEGDRSKLTEATGWEPEVDVPVGMARVVEPYLD